MQHMDENCPIINVDRTVRPIYPAFVRRIEYLSLELTGPTNFDVTKLWFYVHPIKDGGYITGKDIHRELICKNMIPSCIGIIELKAIQDRGINFFRKYFLGEAVFGWKSVVLGDSGCLFVPSLFDFGDDNVHLEWKWISSTFTYHRRVLRHCSM